MTKVFSKWKVLLVVLALIAANFALGASLLQAEKETASCSTNGVCWCKLPGDVGPAPVGACSSLGTGEGCGKGNGGSGFCGGW